MNQEELFYLIPYLLSLVLSLGIFIYTWQHRSVRGARAYSWFVGGQTLTIFGFILELISPNLEIKILWDKFQWLTASFLVILPFLVFSVQFSEYKLRHPRLTWAYWIGMPILFTLILLTDNFHHLIYLNPRLSRDFPFPDLQYDFTVIVYGYTLFYVYGANLYGIGLLIRRALQPYNVHHLQYWTIAVGFLIPITLSILSLFNLRIAPQRDISPFSFAIGNLVVAWGLFRYGLFNLVPIARERVLESLADAIIVLDESNRVVDINKVALANVCKKSVEVIGRPIQEVFTEWLHLVERIQDLDEVTLEITAKAQGELRTYDLSISPIRDKRNHLIGRIFVAHDITKRKMLEERYRQLSEELEQRVHERTEDLRKSIERYRAVVENQSEFIVRWKPDGVCTFVNEAYCRYFNLTPEQATSTSFLSLIVADDRKAVEEKISRLISGTTSSETYIQRVIRPDGTIGWQEWTDRVICDESSDVFEFQSVGRDITERRQAEEALRESEAIYRQAIEVAGAVPYRQSYLGDSEFVDYDFIGEGIFQITGYSPEEFDTALWDSLVQEAHPWEELAKYTWDEAAQKVRSGDISVWKCEYLIQARDGTMRWVFESAVELRDENGVSHGSIGLFQDITERVRAEERLRELTRRVVAAQEEERKRIAQELHDELGQALTAISLDLGGIEKALQVEASSQIKARLNDARSLADEVDERISELALDLRPSLLDDLGLVPTLQWYLRRYSERVGIKATLDFENLKNRLRDEVETTLYRVIQEALTNIARHAQASRVDLSLACNAEVVTARIQDDGLGFYTEDTRSFAVSSGGLGLVGIYDRVSMLGGNVEIQSVPGQGTIIWIAIPL